MKTLGQKMKSIGPARRKRVVTRAASLIAEEVMSQELQQTPKLTKLRLVGFSQDRVSRLEKG